MFQMVCLDTFLVSSGFSPKKETNNLMKSQQCLKMCYKFAMQHTKICNRDEHELQHLSPKTLKTKQLKLFTLILQLYIQQFHIYSFFKWINGDNTDTQMNNTDLSLPELHRRLKEDRKNSIKHNRWPVSAMREYLWICDRPERFN